MREKLLDFIQSLILYDYILFGASFALFILFLTLSIMLRRKTGVAIFLVLLAFSFVSAIPAFGYIEMHKFLYKNSLTLVSQKKLTFIKAVVVKGKIANESKFHFKECQIRVGAYKVSGNVYLDTLYKFIPFKKMTILQKDIIQGEKREFKLFLEPFSYKKEYNITMEAQCK